MVNFSTKQANVTSIGYICYTMHAIVLNMTEWNVEDMFALYLYVLGVNFFSILPFGSKSLDCCIHPCYKVNVWKLKLVNDKTALYRMTDLSQKAIEFSCWHEIVFFSKNRKKSYFLKKMIYFDIFQPNIHYTRATFV